jgi:hypothetical protein
MRNMVALLVQELGWLLLLFMSMGVRLQLGDQELATARNA